MKPKYVYAFGGGAAEGRGDQAELLGGKGAGLAEMSGLGLPVPPGFTITTEACRYFHAHEGRLPPGLEEEFRAHLERLEATLDRTFGDPRRPLLVSVRSGGPVSMPGMMDTILNLGLNDEIVAAQVAAGAEARFLRDSYRRLLQMYGEVVLGVPHEAFEKILGAAREAAAVATDAELSAETLLGVIREYEALLEARQAPFPQAPEEQIWGAIRAVFGSWNNRRARTYRQLHALPENAGTAVNVQAMVFGNRGPDCATGVAFTRDPATGERRLYGEYLANAQGEDVVAGTRTPRSIAPTEGEPGLEAEFPRAYAALEEVGRILEARRRDMQDVEFTIETGRLYVLQTRTGKRSGPAAVRIAVDMVEEGVIEPREALLRVAPEQLAQVLAPVFDPAEKARAIAGGALLARGLAAGPGAASGRIALTAERAAAMASEGPVLLVREETSPEDIAGMHAAVGIITARGGMTSHAAVVARGLGKPCVVGAAALHVRPERKELAVGERIFREGDHLSLDGGEGEVLAGALAPRPSEVLQALLEGGQSAGSRAAERVQRILGWADEVRQLGVRANADTPADARVARALGAEGIGLCRTEHMFFDEARIAWVRQVIVARSAEQRAEALKRLLPEQQSDFEGIFLAMEGLPVTVRLLDPPLHEFLPHDAGAVEVLAAQMEIAPERLRETVEELSEANPMLGHRGCRLGLTAPEIYEMQIEAIARAVAALRRQGRDVRPEIMVPLVGTEEEMRRLRERVSGVLKRVATEESVDLELPIGTMIEVPRAALVAGRIARHADFFSFGTNDLTQMTFGFSRDDAGRFLPTYIEEGVLPADPFAELDQEGVGELVALACARGRATRPDLKLGICGEHGGEAGSIAFFAGAGLDYVSCSPYRVPLARLAAARAGLAMARDHPLAAEEGG